MISLLTYSNHICYGVVPDSQCNAILAISKKLTHQKSLITNSFVGDSHVRILVLPENERDFVERDLDCSMISSGYYEKTNLGLYSLKMLQDSLAATKAGTLPELSLNWKGLGTHVNGKYLTQRISVLPKTESGCSLLDILQPLEEVDPKYFLSEKMIKYITRPDRMKKKYTKLVHVSYPEVTPTGTAPI